MSGVPQQGVAPKPRVTSVPGGCPVYVPCSRSVKVPWHIHIMRLYKLPRYKLYVTCHFTITTFSMALQYMLRVSIYIHDKLYVHVYSMYERPSTEDEISVLSSASPAIQKTIPSNTTCGALALYKYTVRSTPKAGVDLYTGMDCEVVWNQGIDEPYGRQWECFPWFQIIWDYAVYMRHKL